MLEIIFGFRETYAELNEHFEGKHMMFVNIENVDEVIIPANVTVSVSVVVNNMTSNSTQGQILLLGH